MQLSTAIRQRVIELIGVNKITLNTLCTRAGVTSSTIFSFMNGESDDPKSSTVLHICEGFGITLCEFYNSHLFDNVMAEKENQSVK